MMPSTGVTDIISIVPESARAAVVPMPTPTMADRMGTTAGRIARIRMSSAMRAITTPTTSPGPRISGIAIVSSFENSAVTPSGTPSEIRSTTGSFVSGVMSNSDSVNTTEPMAVVPSSETWRISDARSSSAEPSARSWTPWS